MPTGAPTRAQRREQTLEHLRATIPANAARAAEAITAAVPRLGVVDLIRAAVHIADLAALADGDTDDGELSGIG
jgi:hypothetical protein